MKCDDMKIGMHVRFGDDDTQHGFVYRIEPLWTPPRCGIMRCDGVPIACDPAICYPINETDDIHETG